MKSYFAVRKEWLQSMNSDFVFREGWSVVHEVTFLSLKSDSTVHGEWLCSPWRVTRSPRIVTLLSLKSYYTGHGEWLCSPWRVTRSPRIVTLLSVKSNCSPWIVTVRYMKSDSSLFLDCPPPNYLSVDNNAVGTSSLAVAGKLEVLAGADRYGGRWLCAREIGWSKRRHHPGIYCHLVYPLVCRTFVIL